MAFYRLDKWDDSGFSYGKPKFFILLWFFIQDTLFRFSPLPFYGFRRQLLLKFGCIIGKNVKIRPRARLHYPWRIEIGENSWIGDDVLLYSIYPIKIGNNSIISHRSFICTAGHDYDDIYYKTIGSPIVIGNGVWVAADVYVAPGVTIGDNTVIGARSSVFHDIPSGVICSGNPCKISKCRK